MDWQKISRRVKWTLIVLALLIIPSCSASCTWLVLGEYRDYRTMQTVVQQLYQVAVQQQQSRPQPQAVPSPPVLQGTPIPHP